MAGRRNTAKRALPASFGQKSTKSGGGKVVKGSNLTKTKVGPRKSGGVTVPKSGGVRAALVVKKKK